MKLRYLTPLFGAPAAATSIAVAPLAVADPVADSPSCAVVGGSDAECQTPGNGQINDSGPVQFAPLYPWWDGDSWAQYMRDGGRR